MAKSALDEILDVPDLLGHRARYEELDTLTV